MWSWIEQVAIERQTQTQYEEEVKKKRKAEKKVWKIKGIKRMLNPL